MALFKTEIRIQIVGLLFLLGISAIIAKLWWVQVVQGEYYKQKIRGSGEVTVRIPSVRGEIRDKNGVPLVTNRPSYSVDFLLNDMIKGYKEAFGRSKVPKYRYEHTVKGVYAVTNEPDVARIVHETVLPRLEQLGIHEPINDKQLQKHFRTDTLVPYTYLEDIDFKDIAKLSEHDLGLPGIDLPLRSVREYPYGALAAHILGYVGPADTDTEEAAKFTYYQPDVEGKNNVEQAMDKWLRGQAGVRYVKKNAKGVIEGDIGERPPIPGDNVYLTIDARVQTIAENALRVVGRGAAVVADPYTGNILAMASVPSFDPERLHPEHLQRGLEQAHQGRHQPADEPRHPFLRARLDVQDHHRPWPDSSRARATTNTPARAASPTAASYMHCWIGQKGGSHGTLDLEGGLKNSCNAYFFQYGNAAGVDAIDKVANAVGIGQKTGGRFPTRRPASCPARNGSPSIPRARRWSDGHTANLSIGQGYVQASPLADVDGRLHARQRRARVITRA